METNKNVLSRDDFLAMNNDYNDYVTKLSRKRTAEILVYSAIALIIIIFGTPLTFEIDWFWFPFVIVIVSCLVFFIGLACAFNKCDKRMREYGNTLYTEYLKQKDAL